MTEPIIICLYKCDPLVIHDGPGGFRVEWPASFGVHVIAHGLSLVNRFSGQTPRAYSVAEHSVRLARITGGIWRRAALLHDAPECFGINDIHSRVKCQLAPRVRELEATIMEGLWDRFGDGGSWADMEAGIKPTDRAMGDFEFQYFLGKDTPDPVPTDMIPRMWAAEYAEREWLHEWNQCTTSS